MRGMGNMQGMMKKFKKMQKEMEVSQQSLNEKEFIGVASNDLVTVTFTGDKVLQKVDISEDVIDPDDKEMLEDLILIAVNDAISKIDTEEEKVMCKYSQNLNLPGF